MKKKDASEMKSVENACKSSLVKIILCVLFGVASIITFAICNKQAADFFGWYNLTRIVIYLTFITLLLLIFRETPEVEAGEKLKPWIRRLIVITPILALVFAIVNAVNPELGTLIVRTTDTNLFNPYDGLFGMGRPAVFAKITFQIIGAIVFISLLPRFAKQKLWFHFVISSLIALTLLTITGEEISWGQRIFQWETTGFFYYHNVQGETNFHNLATQLFQNVLYFIGGFVLLIILPFFRKQFIQLFSKIKFFKPVITFLPESWMILAFGAGLMFVEPLASNYGAQWGSILFQKLATLVILIVLVKRLVASSQKKFVWPAIRTLICATTVFILSLVFSGLWRQNQGSPGEYIETFINFGFLCWAFRIRGKVVSGDFKKELST